jgi:hypothetical protein
VSDPRPPSPSRPAYKGAPLDADRGPGLGCFWTQVVILAFLLVLTPVGVINGWPIWLTGGLLVLSLVLILFTSLTIIFLLRLVAADRRARRRPLGPGASRTVGQIEDEIEGGVTDQQERAPSGEDPEVEPPPSVRQ